MSESRVEHDRRVVIVPAAERDAAAAEALGSETGFPIADSAWRGLAAFALRIDGHQLWLVDRESKDGNGIEAAFPSLPVRHGRVSIGRNEPLGRAFGPRVETIVDATAGLGHDSVLLACMGFDVTAIERSPALAAMLRWSLSRALENGRIRMAIEGRLRMVQGDARDILPGLELRPDAIYLDPMFPPRRKKSALARKAIRIVRDLVGDDSDANALLSIALASATERVVVKRLDDAPPLMPGTIASIAGTTVRYDVYRAQPRDNVGRPR